ncbi:phospholipase D-like domain-containing protein [uncultured Paracoccus sp.]|uniref:phospholipase D-like domain-containing protein n=1 Tax=uncultured Paracoccus sp. TaxID=189685 RepID=UPI0025D7AA08|nr:phospholipase D-like domain-containing protein [uncultured Paracoccus sp.]
MIELQPGRNCWRIETADRLSVIIDGKAYFRALREALLKAERLVMMVGWDFDFEIEMLPGESDADGIAPDGFPNKVGAFLDAIVDRQPGLDIYLLKWSGGALIAPGGILPALAVKLMSPDQIHLAFDGRHPLGACHHQKIVAIDDSLAFCGGIDMTDGRWDDPGHHDDNPLRCLKSGEDAQPWHDASTVLSGPAAAALSELARARWARAHDAEVDETFDPGADLWPDSIDPVFRDIPLAIARTAPPEADRPGIHEIEDLYLDAIAGARDCIYIESQYFCADSITRAIARRLAEPDGPQIVVINPYAAQGHIEDQAMHITRSRMIRQLRAADPYRRFRILYPVTDSGRPIYVHAKIMIVDDVLLRIGSSNIDRRSMGFDTECDVAIAAPDAPTRRVIGDIRTRLLAEHLGLPPERVAAEIDRRGGLAVALDHLCRPQGRSLRPLLPRQETWLGSILADTRFFDPRYRRSAQARVGVTSRHMLIGAAVLAGGVWLWRRSRR